MFLISGIAQIYSSGGVRRTTIWLCSKIVPNEIRGYRVCSIRRVIIRGIDIFIPYFRKHHTHSLSHRFTPYFLFSRMYTRHTPYATHAPAVHYCMRTITSNKNVLKKQPSYVSDRLCSVIDCVQSSIVLGKGGWSSGFLPMEKVLCEPPRSYVCSGWLKTFASLCCENTLPWNCRGTRFSRWCLYQIVVVGPQISFV